MQRNNKNPHRVDRGRYKKSKTTLAPSEGNLHEVNVVDKVSKTEGKSPSSWFEKAIELQSAAKDIELTPQLVRLEALREAYSQEIFRLFDPLQPKTRPVFTEDGRCYVLSRAIDGFNPFQDVYLTYEDEVINEALRNGDIDNLGTNCGTLLLVNDIDHNMANFGVNDDNHSIRIDSGWAFARLVLRELQILNPKWSPFPVNSKFNITASVIASLPELKTNDYAIYNFGKQIIKSYKNGTQLLPDIKRNVFRGELNANLLKQILTPTNYFHALSQRHIETEDDRIGMETAFVEIANRRLQTLTAALSNKSFCDFLFEKKADEQTDEYDDYLHQDGKSHFKMAGREPIWEKQNPGLFKETLKKLREIARHPINSAERKQQLLAMLKDLIAEIPDNEYKETPLHMAAMAGNTLIAEAALQVQSTDINAKTIDGNTPLLLALQKSDSNFAKFLISQEGIDVTIKNNKNETALDIACRGQEFDLCAQLIQRYPENHAIEGINQDTLHILFCDAIAQKNIKIIKRLISQPTIYQNLVTYSEDKQNNYLISAVTQNNNHEVFSFLLEHVIQTSHPVDPLFWVDMMRRAIDLNKVEKFNLLMNHPKKPDIQPEFYNMLLQTAATKSHLPTVQQLLDHGVDINATSYMLPNPPILQAAKNGRWNVVTLLAASPECNVNAQHDESDRTALHFAVKSGALEAAEALLKRGIDLSLKDSDGKTPAKVKCKMGKTEKAAMSALLAKYIPQEQVDTRALRNSGLHSPLLEKSGNIQSVPVQKKSN